MTDNTTSKATGPSILLVEDTPSQALRFQSCLEGSGCRVKWVERGLEGVSAAHDQSFDLVILDIELPDINGFEVCRQLKSDPAVADIPVIMLTTRDKAEDALVGLGEGAIDYIPKDPFAEIVLLETLKQMGLLSS